MSTISNMFQGACKILTRHLVLIAESKSLSKERRIHIYQQDDEATKHQIEEEKISKIKTIIGK